MAAPLRIVRPYGDIREVSRSSTDDFGLYIERLIKLIPGEVIGLYLVGSGFIPSDDHLVLVVWSLLCLAGLIAIRIRATSDPEENLPPQWGPILISSCAFIIWLYTLGGPFAAYGLYVPYVGSLLVLAWTFFLPLFYKGSLPP